MKKLLLFAGVATIALTGAFAYVITPPPVPLFDANRMLLAESYVEGYCSGIMMFTDVPAQTCRNDNPDMQTHRNLGMVTPAFCTAVVNSGWEGSQQDCESIMYDNLYWPLLDGGITNSWSSRYAYPLDRFLENVKPDESRTGDRKVSVR